MTLSRAALARIAPFALFMALLALRGAAPADDSWGFDPRWLYGASVLLVGGLLGWLWREYGELAAQTLPTAREALLAVCVGVVMVVAWIQLDAAWMRIGEPSASFMPFDAHGRIEWPLVAVRWIGAALVVPVMEELFWRSFLMRWVDSARFETVDPMRVSMRAIVASTFVFTLAHTQWLAAAVAGLAYVALYRQTGKLWMPVVAHAVTNAALGVWVVATGSWRYW
jgi:CAAX prenyl protease-like protein